jgi:hypothetical protein
MKGMSKEEAVAVAIFKWINGHDGFLVAHPEDKDESREGARLAIAAADKWDAEQSGDQTDADALRKQAFTMPAADQFWLASMIAENVGWVLAPKPEHTESPRNHVLGNTETISPGLDSAIQDELDHPPASIMEEGK